LVFATVPDATLLKEEIAYTTMLKCQALQTVWRTDKIPITCGVGSLLDDNSLATGEIDDMRTSVDFEPFETGHSVAEGGDMRWRWMLSMTG
jgi:hypothetical protein